MGPAKRSKHTIDFKFKVIQFAKENGNRAAARLFDVSKSSTLSLRTIKMTIRINNLRNNELIKLVYEFVEAEKWESSESLKLENERLEIDKMKAIPNIEVEQLKP
ncbi:hypothetical protein CDAR_181241 [Caerostris darwini]|uniref:HTH psq-type domain-containing protein n=1 Tax=Caerostris darwini TaxID=1538125 RepID=A0AAV4U3Z3_9ARAC|nr:hypothetical protein CDAR_181241 [Caerostris darwini]